MLIPPAALLVTLPLPIVDDPDEVKRSGNKNFNIG
jgi:hypothetical protein